MDAINWIKKFRADMAAAGIVAQPASEKPNMLKPFTPAENAAALNESVTVEADRREMNTWQVEGDLERLDPPGGIGRRVRAFEAMELKLENEAGR